MKPATKEKILIKLENLRNPPARTIPGKRIRIQCFGDFEIFADNIINNGREGIAVLPDQFDCDYYMALSGNQIFINSFTGEYMTSYFWAEFTAGALITKFK